MKVVRMSALRTGRLYFSEDITGTLFCWGRVEPKAIVWLAELG